MVTTGATGQHASIGLIPTNDDATCVFVAVPWPRFRAEIDGSRARRTSGSFAPRSGARCPAARRAAGRAGSRIRRAAGFIRRGTAPAGRSSATPRISRIR